MEILNYGEFEIATEVQKTSEYYSDLSSAETQAARNFAEYCKSMAEEEKAFFESFGIDVTKAADIKGFYHKKASEFACFGSCYFCGDFIKADFGEEPSDDPEEIVEYKDTAFMVGNFEISFENPLHEAEMGAPEGFHIMYFSCNALPWLLEEKPQKDIIAYEEPKKWEIHKRIFEAARAKKAVRDIKRQNIKYIEETLTESGLEYRKMGKREYERYCAEWLKRMTPGFADEKNVREHCLGEGCFLWHLFSFSYAHAVDGEEASAEFDVTKKCKSILICSCEETGYVLSHTYKLKAETLKKLRDVIVTSANFAWTYCKTHESDCGPYFYRPKKK